MPAFCPHSRKPLKELASVYPSFRGIEGTSDYGISPEGVIYYLKAKSLNYGPDYFLSEYENQYGRSYLEDEPALKKLALSRMDWMEESIGKAGLTVDWPAEGPTLVEIGSAAGFFLDGAKERGFRTLGVEVSEFAAGFAESRGHLIIKKSFLAPDCLDEIRRHMWGKGFPGESAEHKEGSSLQTMPGADIAAAFYTLEHFPDQQLAFKRLAQLLKPGGLLLLSIPSYHGPLFRCSPQQWLNSHPQDHFADYSPDSLSLTLQLYGLKLIEVRPASFHRKRACGWIRYLGDSFYKKWALKHRFGDTMEVLAAKPGLDL